MPGSAPVKYTVSWAYLFPVVPRILLGNGQAGGVVEIGGRLGADGQLVDGLAVGLEEVHAALRDRRAVLELDHGDDGMGPTGVRREIARCQDDVPFALDRPGRRAQCRLCRRGERLEVHRHRRGKVEVPASETAKARAAARSAAGFGILLAGKVNVTEALALGQGLLCARQGLSGGSHRLWCRSDRTSP